MNKISLSKCLEHLEWSKWGLQQLDLLDLHVISNYLLLPTNRKILFFILISIYHRHGLYDDPTISMGIVRVFYHQADQFLQQPHTSLNALQLLTSTSDL